MTVVQFNWPEVISSAKWAHTTRRVPKSMATHLVQDLSGHTTGDLVLARIEKIGSHRRLQTRDANHSNFFPGDLIVAVCAARFATDQFEGIVKNDISGSADLLAGGGVIGHSRSRNGGMKVATKVRVLGLLTNASGRKVNLKDHTLSMRKGSAPETVIGVIGTAMNSGKTDAAAWLLNGLEGLGKKSAGIKLTGTGSFGDTHSYTDAGASVCLDFTDFGLASTYKEPIGLLKEGFDTLLAHAAEDGCAAAVVELADGITQVETAELLSDPAFVSKFSGFIMATAEPLAAISAQSWLATKGITPLAFSGLLTKSPLASVELSKQTDIPVLSREELADPAIASMLIIRSKTNLGINAA